jgi:DNA polymerase-3 subunit delta
MSVVTITGTNDFMRMGEVRALVAQFVAEYGDLALEQIDGEEAEFDRLREALQSLPFLASKKLVLLRNPGNNKAFVAAAEQLLTELPDSTEVIVAETKLDKRLAYYKFLKQKTDFRDFPELGAPELASWLVMAAKAQDGTLSSSDAAYLVERVGANQQLLHNELAKLLLHSKSISRATIDLLTDKAPQSTIFELLDTALSGRTQQALELYAEQRAMKVEPQQILALLAWQLHIMAVVKTADGRSVDDIARQAKLNPFVVRKTSNLVNHMSLTEVKKLVQSALQLDVRLKSENIDADEALQNLIVSL